MVSTRIEKARLQLSKNTRSSKKAKLGQFLTPGNTAKFMASLFEPTSKDECHLLEPGAGIGSLAAALLERVASGELTFKVIDLTAYEIDQSLHRELSRTLKNYEKTSGFSFQILGRDFVESAVGRILSGERPYTHAILNPPYKKIGSNSRVRLLLRKVGIETVNFYAAFLALTISLMSNGGQIVAIVPRSFCNGPYYRPFRKFLLSNVSIVCLHLFDSRRMPFKDDKVLQENVILLLERGGSQGSVVVSHSMDNSFEDFAENEYPFDQIVSTDDSEHFIHIPVSLTKSPLQSSLAVLHTLEDLDISVSTGPVVDFRLKEHLSQGSSSDSVPLIYAGHFHSQQVKWPKPRLKKPDSIRRNAETEKWLYPLGYYCLVRRFSAKEERRRIVAAVFTPEVIPKVGLVGFENHLNIFHCNKGGLPELLAWGLMIYLNSTLVDDYFRRFSGHTQVNATDLRQLGYPSKTVLIELGMWLRGLNAVPTQAEIDSELEGYIT